LREWTDEVKEMFKESEDKYTRFHGIEKRRWLRWLREDGTERSRKR
jgi:hypothetical protein